MLCYSQWRQSWNPQRTKTYKREYQIYQRSLSSQVCPSIWLFKLLSFPSLCQMISQHMSLQIVTVVGCVSTISAYIWTPTMYLFNMSLHIAISMCYVIHNYDILKVPKEPKHIWENTTYIKDPWVPKYVHQLWYYVKSFPQGYTSWFLHILERWK